MGLKNTQKLRDIGQRMANWLKDNPDADNLIMQWELAIQEYEELLNKRKDKKNRKREEKKLAKARGENKG